MRRYRPTNRVLFFAAAAAAAAALTVSALFSVAVPPGVKNITTGVTYTSVAAALAAVQPGQILELLETAVYSCEKLDMTVANVTLRAASGRTPTLDGGYKDYCLRAAADGIAVSGAAFVNGKNYGMKVENASGVSLSGLAFVGWFARNGLYASSAPGLQLSAITFENCGDAGVSLNNSTSVSATGLTATNIASRSCKSAVEVVSCTNPVLSALDVGTNWSDVIVVSGSSGARFTNVTISSGAKGFSIANSPNTEIRTCTMGGLWAENVYARDTDGLVFDGGSVNVQDTGFDLSNCPNASIFNCALTTTSGAFGVKAVNSPNLTVRSGSVAGAFWSSGIYTKNCTGTTVRNMVVKNCAIGINLDDDSNGAAIVNNTIAFNQSSGIFIASGCQNVTVKNNIIVSNAWSNWKWGIQCQSTDHPGLSITFNDVWNNRADYQNCSPGVGSISADPLFTAPPGDLHERTESPCVDAGDPTDSVGDEPAPNGGRINQGAYGGTSEAATSPSQIVLSLADAASNGWISLYCYTWDGTQYIPLNGMSTSLLPPWTGFWVSVNRSLDLLFPPDAGQPSPPGTMTLPVDPLRYYLISSPLLPSNGDQAVVFGDDIGGSPETEWRVSKYNYLTGAFQRYTGTGSIPGVIPGRGFWLYVNLEEPKTLAVAGSPASQTTPYALKFPANGSQATYHITGNPFPYAFHWGSVQVRVPVTDGLPLAKPAAAALDETEVWYIGLELADATGTYRDTHNRAGVIKKGPDYHTVLSAADLASINSARVRLALRDPDDPGRGLLAFDYRRPGLNEYRWRIELSSTVDALAASVALTNFSSVPSNWRITVTDEATGGTTVISADTSIPVTLSSSGTKTYLLTATNLLPMGTEPPAPAVFGITGVSPNPFNPSTEIEYTLNRPGNARIVVYSLTGQKAATLADGFMPAGKRSVRWNAAGLASGVYIVVLETAGGRDSRKITLVK